MADGRVEGDPFHGACAPLLVRRSERTLGAVLLLFTLGVWGTFLSIGGGTGAILDMGLLAFLMGIRHGFDADHIAVIDTLTRRLSPASVASRSVGFLFAAGHSSVVILSNLVLIAFLHPYQGVLGRLAPIGSWMGTFFSAGFLTFIGLVNLLIILGMLRRTRKRTIEGPILSGPPSQSSPLPPFPLRPATSSKGVFLVGVLFGLSLDTSAEIALLLLALALQVPGPHHLFILGLIPALFAAGMISVDTLDGVVMARAYHWAMKDFNRTLLYNLTLTGLSVFVAWGVGTLEWVRLFRGKTVFEPSSWAALGLGILGGFMSLWALMAVLRMRRGRRLRGIEG